MNSKPCGNSCCQKYLSDVSPRDKPWDVHKAQSRKVSDLYHGTIKDRLAGRLWGCSGQLQFGYQTDPETGEQKLKLKSALFCRGRHCPICQWRRSLMWTARFLKAMPNILQDHPSARFLFLTLTVQNCEITDLRSTLDWMNKSWQRMTQRKQFPAIGFARSTEVTRGSDDTAHPHFHALLMVPSTYFNGKYYLAQKDWTELWASCLRVNYTPIVNIKAVKPNKRWLAENDTELAAEQLLAGAIVETFKYSVKPQDLIGEGTEADRQWLLQLTKQLEKTRAIALGGVFKNYLAESEPEDLVGKDDNEDNISASSVYFRWHDIAQRYLKAWED